MKALYLAIANKIIASTSFQQASLAPIRHIDLYAEQYIQTERQEIFETPALFFEFFLSVDDTLRKPPTYIQLNTHLLVTSLQTTAIRQGIATSPDVMIYDYRSIIRSIITQTKGQDFSAPQYQETSHITRLDGGLILLRERYTAQLYEEITLSYMLQQAPDDQPISINTLSKSIVTEAK